VILRRARSARLKDHRKNAGVEKERGRVPAKRMGTFGTGRVVKPLLD
jgi:hypothetical protein